MMNNPHVGFDIIGESFENDLQFLFKQRV